MVEPVLKPWFLSTMMPVTVCNLFLWEIGLCSAFRCASNSQASDAHTPLAIVDEPYAGTTAPGSAASQYTMKIPP